MGRRTVNWNPVHDGRTAFRIALEALAYPGRPKADLPTPGLVPKSELDDAAAGLALALLDPGLRVAVTPYTPTAEGLSDAFHAATGCLQSDVAEADFVLVLSRQPAGRDLADAIRHVRRGSAHAPQEGAWVIASAVAPATPHRLTAPGWGDSRVADLCLTPEDVLELMVANAGQPAGVDLLLVTPAGLVAIPRYVEVVSA